MKLKFTPIVVGLMGLILLSGCSATAPNKNLRCLPCEAAKPQVIPVTPEPVVVTPAPVVKATSNCLPCEEEQAVEYVAPAPPPPPAPTPVVKDCLECIDGQPNYSKYQWY